MIRMLLNGDRLPQELTPDWAAAYIRMRVTAYGVDKPFSTVYVDENGCCLSILDGNGVMAGNVPQNAAEWTVFLNGLADLKTLLAPETLLCAVLPFENGKTAVLSVMRYTGNFETPSDAVLLSSPRAVHPLLCAAFGEDDIPPFDSFYVDTAYRLRHGMCHIAAIEGESALLSAAMTVAETQDAAVIGAVATLPQHRKKGYAAMCLQALIQTLRAEQPGRAVYILPKDVSLQRFYENSGFSVVSTALYCRKKGF